MTGHMKAKHNVDVFYCSECTYSDKNRSFLEKHAHDVHRNKDGDNKKEVEESAEAAYICGQCGKSFLDLHSCTVHMDTHLYKCYKCNFETKDQVTIKKHERAKHELLQCNEGNDVTTKVTTEEVPKAHFNINESEPQCVTCPFCNLESKNLAELKIHIENIHTSKPSKPSKEDAIHVQRPDTCSKCPDCAFIGSKCELNKQNKYLNMRSMKYVENVVTASQI